MHIWSYLYLWSDSILNSQSPMFRTCTGQVSSYRSYVDDLSTNVPLITQYRRKIKRVSWHCTGKFATPMCVLFKAPNCCIQLLTNSVCVWHNFETVLHFLLCVSWGFLPILRSSRHLCGVAKPVSRKVCEGWWVFLRKSLVDFVVIQTCLYHIYIYIYP